MSQFSYIGSVKSLTGTLQQCTDSRHHQFHYEVVVSFIRYVILWLAGQSSQTVENSGTGQLDPSKHSVPITCSR